MMARFSKPQYPSMPPIRTGPCTRSFFEQAVYAFHHHFTDSVVQIPRRASRYTDVTGGSRVCYATGMAVIRAAEDVREQLKARAATIWIGTVFGVAQASVYSLPDQVPTIAPA